MLLGHRRILIRVIIIIKRGRGRESGDVPLIRPCSSDDCDSVVFKVFSDIVYRGSERAIACSRYSHTNTHLLLYVCTCILLYYEVADVVGEAKKNKKKK